MTVETSPSSSAPLLAVALIATHNRARLLQERALASILAQERAPDLVVIVDDSQPYFRHDTNEVVADAAMLAPRTRFELLLNHRAPGASGAWNTGLRWLATQSDPRKTVVLLLDDDDAWEPQHVGKCLEALQEGHLDVVATGMARIEREGTPGRIQLPPLMWMADQFLIGNPHIQASNLAVRLSVLLDAGMFDEGLLSCTDRDLCLRVLDGADVRYGTVQTVTVRHFAEASRGRLSTPGSRAKHLGLDAFWRKYRDRMTPDQHAAFLARNAQLFRWLPPGSESSTAWLVVGIIADASLPERVSPLLEQLLELAKTPAIEGIDVVVLENGPLPLLVAPSLVDAVATLRARGLRVWRIPLDQQLLDARSGCFGEPFERTDGRAGIAVARTMLQAYVYALARRRPGCIGWILDDDKRIGAWTTPETAAHLVDVLIRLRADGVSVALGVDAGSAPLPVLATVRGELVDLKANLDMLLGLDPDQPVPNRAAENAQSWRKSHSPYHDLAQGDGQHLEAPFWWQPRTPCETASEALDQIALAADGLLRGAPIFRVLPPPEMQDPVLAAKTSTQRGGCTWLLDIDVLSEVPNLMAEIDGDPCRRSDMVWSLLLAKVFGRKVVQVPLAVEHDRSEQQVGQPWRDLLRDVRGHAIHMALTELFDRASLDGSRPCLEWSDDELTFYLGRFRHHLQVRVQSFEHQSVPRVGSLLVAIRQRLKALADRPAWRTQARAEDAVRRLLGALDDLELLVSKENVASWLNAAKHTPEEPIRSFVSDLDRAILMWRGALANRGLLLASLEQDREVIAKGGVLAAFETSDPLQVLGTGHEGVVFTDGQNVFKWFDALPARNREVLRSLCEGFGTASSLPRVDAVVDFAGHTIVRYPYEPTEEYQGGRGAALVALLAECRAVGIVCNNLHPKNLRVAGARLLLVDLGSDIMPWSEGGWTAMCRRAFLSWRWWFRSDLDALMTRSLSDPQLPELAGVNWFQRALDDPPAPVEKRKYILDQVRRLGAGRVLDYGCGPGRLDAELAEAGVEVVAYDPDETHEARWRKTEASRPGVSFGDRKLLEQLRSQDTQFDAVICSIVLCVLENGPAYEAVLADLHRFAKSDGRVLVAVCNPFETFGRHTPFTTRTAPADVEYDDTFSWPGTCCSTGRTRDDVHRPLRVVERDLLRHGMVVESRWFSDTVDLKRFEPASDFVVLTLRPVPSPPQAVTLAIKTCVMDWRTLKHQVRHMVRQLEGDFAFAERLLVVDNRASSFARAHDAGDAPAFDLAVARLLRFGLIDRVIRCPETPEALRDLAKRWFGIDAAISHGRNGNPVAATMAAFDATQTPYLLQVDSDLMVRRNDLGGVRRLVEALEADEQAVTVSLSVVVDERVAPTMAGPTGPWRAEVRGCLLHLERLRALRPLPNSPEDGHFALPWHRSLDWRVQTGRTRSLRLSDPALGFVHPQNARKAARDEWMAVLDRCEAGFVPALQLGKVDWSGSIEAWLGPRRSEPLVVVMQGRNVPAGRLMRAIKSLQAQRRTDWGAILVDDGSDPIFAEFIRVIAPTLGPRWTVLRTPIRRGGMANLVWAVRHVCANPHSVVVTLDADDALIGDRVLGRLHDVYAGGADLTVGAMLRTDKEITYEVRFDNARRRPSGGCVWQHLRSFRKHLFDRVPDNALKLGGRYIEVAQDWAFMLAMVEVAQHPVALADKLYLYEPWGEGKGDQRAWREQTIGCIVAMAPLTASIGVDSDEEQRRANG